MPVKTKKNTQSKAVKADEVAKTSKASQKGKPSPKGKANPKRQPSKVVKKTRRRRITVQQRRSIIANLLDTHGGPIYGFTLSVCSEPELAEYVMQETFAQAYQKLNQLIDLADPTPWFHAMIVKNYLQEIGKQRGDAATLRPLPELYEYGEKAKTEPVRKTEASRDAAIRKKAMTALIKALRELPFEIRIPLLLRDTLGYSLREVSKILDIKKPDVRTRLHRARSLIFWPVAAVLPRNETSPSRHTRREWQGILRAKQVALDEDKAFEFGRGEFCKRCEVVFLAMDYIHNLCRDLVSEEPSAVASQAVLLDLVCTI